MTEPTASSIFETFTRLFRDWDEALVANDAERIRAFTTPGWMFLSPIGPSAGSRFLEAVATGTVLHDTMNHEVTSVVELGQVAIVIARVVNTGAYQGEPFESDEWTSDVFVLQDGRWRCELSHLTPART